jgi:hypothetical protein
MLTTIVPSKETVDVVARTLRKMLKVAYYGTVDVWIIALGGGSCLGDMRCQRHG